MHINELNNLILRRIIMTFQQKYGFSFSNIMSEKILYNNAILFIEEFEEELKTGKIIDIGPAYGFKFHNFLELFSGHMDDDITESHYNEMATGKMSVDNPLREADEEIFYTFQKYAELNVVHLNNLNLSWLSSPDTKINAFQYLDENQVLVSYDIEKDFHATNNITGLSALISLDKNSSTSKLINNWFLSYHLFKDNEFIGIVQADLVTSENKFDDNEYFMAMDEDSDFLANEAHGIISNYLLDINTPHNDINELYTDNFELSPNAGTLHIINAELREDFKDSNLISVMLSSLITILSNANVSNINKYIEVGFNENSYMTQLSSYYGKIKRKYYESKLNIEFISLITANISNNPNCLTYSKKPLSMPNNLSIVEDSLRSFHFDCEVVGVSDEPPVKVFLHDNPIPNQENGYALLSEHINS